MKRNKIIILAILLVALLTSSCQTSRTSRVSQAQIQLVQYSLKKTDLPGSWSIEGESWGADYGGESYAVTYIHEKLVFITHMVSIYPNEDQAQLAYKEWESEWFSIAKFKPVTSFSPMNTDDTFRYECEQKDPDGPLGSLRLCIYLQQQNEIVSFVKISLDESSKDNLTIEEINDILGVLDERLNEVVIDAKPESDSP